MKNYYDILGVSRDARPEDIRRAFRALALRWHPDRNPDSAEAAVRFREVAEAYGVLIDPGKRLEFDRTLDRNTAETQQDFRYSQEEILSDLFRNSQFSGIFEELFREFERTGMRGDRRFFRQIFPGGMVFGGIFVFGPFGLRGGGASRQRGQLAGAGQDALFPPEGLRRIGRALSGLLGGRAPLPEPAAEEQDLDVTFHLSLSPEQAREGNTVQIALDRGAGQEKLNVRIPAGTRDGARLRLAGRGRRRGRSQGDLFVVVHATG